MRTPARATHDAEIDPALLEPLAADRVREDWLPMIAIVGRPNVGKSTLYNRILGARDAIVHDLPGVTRDRRINRAEYCGTPFLLTDTGGFDEEIDDPLISRVVDQARLAVSEADLIILLTAVGEEEHPADRALLQFIRTSQKPVLFAVNKCDNPKLEHQSGDFYRYGFETLYPISAQHGGGVAELMDDAMELLEKVEPPAKPTLSGGIAVAIVGRQNVGKSSLANRLLGEERLIASDVPGTTRDAIDTTLRTDEGDVFTFIDTAGIRRRGKIERGVERLSVMGSLIALRRADVAILVIDAEEGLTAQDAHIASHIVEHGVACILAVNKWDLVEKDSKTADAFTKSLQREWGFLAWAPVIYISALTGQRTHRLFDLIKRAYLNAERRIPTPRLNEMVQMWIRRRPLPPRKNRQPKIKYVAQTGVHPPTFTFFTSEPALIHFSYRRYLANRLREVVDFEGTPIRLFFKEKSGDQRSRKKGRKRS